MDLLESLKNAVAVELTATDNSELVNSWEIFNNALNATKTRKEVEDALEYTKSKEFIKCVALPNNYTVFIENFLNLPQSKLL